MKTKTENRTLTIFLEGRIDTNNAGEVEREISEAVGNRDDSVEHVVMDAGALEYISSAGLRVLMKLRKELKEPLRISEVSRDVYEIFETTGFTELFDIRKALREAGMGSDVRRIFWHIRPAGDWKDHADAPSLDEPLCCLPGTCHRPGSKGDHGGDDEGAGAAFSGAGICV